jgi:hypothetical protein
LLVLGGVPVAHLESRTQQLQVLDERLSRPDETVASLAHRIGDRSDDIVRDVLGDPVESLSRTVGSGRQI